MRGHHQLTGEQISALASGLGGEPIVRELFAGRCSRHLLLLKYVGREWPAGRGHLDAAIGVLASAQRRSAARFDDLIGDPLVGAWLAATVRRLRSADPAAIPLSRDLLHLGALAASAALITGIDCQLTGYAVEHRLTLPALGELALPGAADEPVRIDVEHGRATVTWSAGTATMPDPGPDWRPLRRLSARHGGIACTVTIEDGNPYRDGYHVDPADRLTPMAAAAWQDLFAGAWDLLAGFLPDRAAELAVGLRALVPLVDDDSGAGRSGTARDSAGALGLTTPRSPSDLAVTMVHEFQHSKLSALLDLVPMCTPGGTERHFAPWREDARPTGGLLHGVYAFLGVADVWRALRAAPDVAEPATAQFAFAREQVTAGVSALEHSAELTAAGRSFTAGLREAVDRLRAEPLPAAALDIALRSLDRRRSTWLARNPGLTAQVPSGHRR